MNLQYLSSNLKKHKILTSQFRLLMKRQTSTVQKLNLSYPLNWRWYHQNQILNKFIFQLRMRKCLLKIHIIFKKILDQFHHDTPILLFIFDLPLHIFDMINFYLKKIDRILEIFKMKNPKIFMMKNLFRN